MVHLVRSSHVKQVAWLLEGSIVKSVHDAAMVLSGHFGRGEANMSLWHLLNPGVRWSRGWHIRSTQLARRRALLRRHASVPSLMEHFVLRGVARRVCYLPSLHVVDRCDSFDWVFLFGGCPCLFDGNAEVLVYVVAVCYETLGGQLLLRLEECVTTFERRFLGAIRRTAMVLSLVALCQFAALFKITRRLIVLLGQ